MLDQRRSDSRERRHSRSCSRDHQPQRSSSKKDRLRPKGKKKKDSRSHLSSRSAERQQDQEPRPSWEREHTHPRTQSSSGPTQEDYDRAVHKPICRVRRREEIHGFMDSRLSKEGQRQQEEIRSRKCTSHESSRHSTPHYTAKPPGTCMSNPGKRKKMREVVLWRNFSK